MKKIFLFTTLIFCLFSSCQSPKEKALTIATASNMQFAMEILVKAFEVQTKIKTNIIISSSGKLCAQIKEGAPYHIFVSADMKFPEDIFQSNFAISKPEIYAYGNLVLWSMIDGLQPSFEQLTDKNIHHVAIANPKTAPYGVAAIQTLKYHNSLDATIKQKLVYGESISQTNQFIISKAAEIGFTAKSIVLSPKMKNKGHWIDVDKKSYTPIEQGVVLIKQDEYMLKKAKQFRDFLFSKEGQEILTSFGYEVK